MKFYFILIINLMFISNIGGQTLYDQLIIAYPISGSVIDTVSGHNCSLNGNLLDDDRNGGSQSSILLNGTSYLECGLPIDLDTLDLPISFSFWYYIDNQNSNDFLPVFFTDDNNGNVGNYYGFFAFFENGKFWFGYGDGQGAFIGNRRGVFSNSTMITNQWTNITGTIDINKNFLLYVDGISVGVTSNGGSNNSIAHNSSFPIRIGVRSRYGPVYFKGKLDEIYLWNRVLNSNDVTYIYNNGLFTNTVNIVQKPNINIFPNPTTNHLTIQNAQGTAIIYNLLGQPLKKITITNKEQQIYVNNLPKGQYFIKIQDEDGIIVTKRFVK